MRTRPVVPGETEAVIIARPLAGAYSLHIITGNITIVHHSSGIEIRAAHDVIDAVHRELHLFQCLHSLVSVYCRGRLQIKPSISAGDRTGYAQCNEYVSYLFHDIIVKVLHSRRK